MKIYDTTLFEKLNINKINFDDIKHINQDNEFIKLYLDKMEFTDLMLGDIVICKNKTVFMFVLKRHVENIIELHQYENEQHLFIDINPFNKNDLSFMPGTCYEKTFPKHIDKHSYSQAYNIVEVFRLFEKPELDKFDKNDFVEYLNNAKIKIENMLKNKQFVAKYNIEQFKRS